ncbi:MAG TPA: molybdopterin cofactor-binding domain-containing protein [Acidimicrobiales bacterium]|nr:molybdopterin cofactor-binding domain-containing protein [Acidimicrobiales bacterium]
MTDPAGRYGRVGTDRAGGALVPRRRFLGYLIAGPTLAAAAPLGVELVRSPARASLPSAQLSDAYDLSDLLTDAARPTSNLITVVVNPDGTASFAVPRAEVGQGITTAVAMTIADEMDLAVAKVHVTLADARPELVWNQLTGGSNTMHAIYTPVRVAAAIARDQLVAAAAALLGVPAADLSTDAGVVTAPDGRTATYGQLATLAAAASTSEVSVTLKADSQLKVVGTPQSRIDARDIVTGRKTFTMDLDVPGALPTMVCRPPTINGTVVAVDNLAQVKGMPGITDVAVVPTGVAVRGATFGQCIDAVDALQVKWGPGTAEGKSDTSVLAELRAAELPLAPDPDPLARAVDRRFTFYFVSNSPLETNCAVADVRSDRAEIWSSLKSPIVAQQTIAQALNLQQDAVTVHVTQGGGSFGRHLFFDAALEAARISQAMGKPVKLMWHRTDDFRQGRAHPMCTSRVRMTFSGGNVLSFQQRHTSVSTDFSHGLGEILSASVAKVPEGNLLAYSQGVFSLSQSVPYAFGAAEQMLNEVDTGFNTGSMRNVYSPDVTTAIELVVDEVAAGMGMDPYRFRRTFATDQRSHAVLDKVAAVGQWGRPMPAGTAQGLGLHSEYKSRAAVLAEIDCRPETVQRQVENGYTGPRVTKLVLAVDVGLPINPRGLEAQMQGGIMDGIAKALTFSLHMQDGLPVEGSWDETYYTRQWNVPLDVQVIVMPTTTGQPGGAGEFGVAPTMAAVACAYARATGTVPTAFPVNHDRPLGFTPLPAVPPLPEEPTDGLSQAF